LLVLKSIAILSTNVMELKNMLSLQISSATRMSMEKDKQQSQV